ncbi:SDR family NAD(P)-dependent oxidoreductase [Paraburkholderia sp. GAS348]|uniref:SDR family NAD(P)-dependent oxidoreductase n=1 Tax=Paraburkholderia sp. GAS348 TaxID=3035132 RepID=UPI003D22515F
MKIGGKRVLHRRIERHRPRARARAGALKETAPSVSSIAADITTPDGRAPTIAQAFAALGGLDILVNNVGGVRAGRLETISDTERTAMMRYDRDS